MLQMFQYLGSKYVPSGYNISIAPNGILLTETNQKSQPEKVSFHLYLKRPLNPSKSVSLIISKASTDSLDLFCLSPVSMSSDKNKRIASGYIRYSFVRDIWKHEKKYFGWRFTLISSKNKHWFFGINLFLRIHNLKSG